MCDRPDQPTSRFLIFSLIFLIPFFYTSSFAQAGSNAENQKPEHSWDKFSLGAGGFVSSTSSSIVLGLQQLGAGVQIDIEDALGLETSTFVSRFYAKYRIGENRRHIISLGFFDLRRTAKKVLEEEIKVGDEVFPIGTEISSIFDMNIIRAKYGYSFLQDERISMGASFGFYIMPVNFSAKALNYTEQHTQFTAPLPLIGLYTDLKLKNKFYLSQSIEFLYLSIQNFSGRIIDLNIAIEHKTFNHFGFGFGANLNGLNLSVTQPGNYLDFVGKIGMQYSGLMLYAKYNL